MDDIPILVRVAKLSKDRLIVEIPKVWRDQFKPGESVFIVKKQILDNG